MQEGNVFGNIKIEHLQFRNSEGQKFNMPILNDLIRTNLLKRNKSKTLSYETLVQYLESEDPKSFNIYRKYEKELLHSESLTIAEEKYVPESYFIETSNYENLDFHLKNLANIDNPNMKFIIGARGIGKTLSMNIALRRNFEYLCKNQILFARCDAKKYLRLKRFEVNKNSFTISDYINIQFLYVICENLNIPFYKGLVEIFESENVTYMYRNAKKLISDSDNNNNKPEFRSVASQLKKIHEDILFHLKYKGGHYGREMIMDPRVKNPAADSRAYDNWISLSIKVQNYLRDHGYKILKILDGIDNVEKYDSNCKDNKDFKKLLKNAHSFESNEKRKSFLWFFMRSNTFRVYYSSPDIKNENERNQIFGNQIVFDLIPNDKFMIIEKRQTLIEDSVISQIPIDKDFISPQNIIYEIDGISRKLIDHSRHIEDFLYNWLAFVFSQKVFHKYTSKEFINGFYIDNLLLNGKFFLNTYDRKLLKRENGNIVFNIFFYDKDIHNTSNIWHGWCTTRIMQYITNFGRVKENEIIKVLHENFHYIEDQIKINLHALLIYGFVRYKEDENSPELVYEVTESGKYLLDFFFSNLEILYYCALDTPLPDDLVSEGKISSHSNDTLIKNFAKNCVNTSTTFINYLFFQHNAEIKRLKRNSNFDFLKRIFTNPFDLECNYNVINQRIKYLET